MDSLQHLCGSSTVPAYSDGVLVSSNDSLLPKLHSITLEGQLQRPTEVEVDSFLKVIADILKRVLADEAALVTQSA